MSKFLALLLTSLLVALAYGAEGDAYVYRVSNGYNNEVRGKVSYRVEKAQGNRVETSVSPDNPASGSARTEVSGKDGNWIRRALASHDRAMAMAPSTPSFWNNRGLLHARRCDQEAALKDFDRAIGLNGNHAAAWVGRGGQGPAGAATPPPGFKTRCAVLGTGGRQTMPPPPPTRAGRSRATRWR